MAKILVVEDEVLLARSIARSLTRAGHACRTTKSAEEGLEMVAQERPDVVLMDLRLEGMDGIESLKRIKQYALNIAVIIMTAYGSAETAVAARQAGAFDYLAKPLDLEVLKQVVSRALASLACS